MVSEIVVKKFHHEKIYSFDLEWYDFHFSTIHYSKITPKFETFLHIFDGMNKLEKKK